MQHPGKNPASDESHAANTWAAAAFEALEMPAILLDENFTFRIANAAWRHRFFDRDARPEPGVSATTVMRALTVDTSNHRIASYNSKDLVGLIKACARDYELPRKGKEPLLLTSTPTKDGGYLVTLRDPDRGRISEESALALLRESTDALDMGMMVWDAGLIVRAVNDTWSRHLTPVRPGDPVDGIGGWMNARGMGSGKPGERSDQSFADVLVDVHRHPRRWEVRRGDGRIIRVVTFPTQSGGVLCVATDVTDRQDIEARARRLLSDAVQSLGEGVLLLDGNLRCRMFNHAFLKLVLDPGNPPPLGTSVPDLIRMSIGMKLVRPPEGMSEEKFITSIEHEIVTCQKGVFAEHSRNHFVERTTYPTAMGGYVVIFRDVTERVRAETDLRASEQRTRTIVETIGEGIALYNADLQLELNNAAFRHLMFQNQPLSAPGMHVAEEIRNTISAGTLPVPPNLGELAAEEMLAEVLQAIAERRKDMEVRMAGGKILEASMYETAQGGFITVLRDITTRKQAEHAAHEADDLLRTIVASSPTTFLVTRLDDGKVIYAPDPTIERFGSIESAKSFFLDPTDRDKYVEALSQTGSLTDYPIRFRRHDGSIMDGLTSARIVGFRGEKLIVSSTRDISEQLAMQSELERQRELAHQNEKLSALGGLLAGVAHELNNPLSIIVVNAMMLEEDLKDPQLRRRVERLASAAKRSGRIVKTFLAMARNRPMRLERASVNEIVETAIEVSAYGLRTAGAELCIDLDPDDPSIEVDADQIIQVLSNLIINSEYATKDLGEDARLSVATRGHDGTVLIEVRDNGSGVPVDLHRRIFEPYFTTKEIGEGTGVGLAFCHRVVTAHGGKITVHAAQDGGAMFRISLPCHRADIATRVNAAETASGRSANVLVLDDEPDVAESVAEALSRAGYDTQMATTAEQALTACDRIAFDAILSDVRMPGTSGLGFFEQLRSVHPQLAHRLAFMTGDAMGQSRDGGITRTGRPFLEKPAEPEEILRLVAKLIEENTNGR